MHTTGVGRRYAVALCDLAKEKALLDEVEAELRLVAETIEEDEKVRGLISHQGIEPGEKGRLLLALFGDRLSLVVQNFLRLVIVKRREAHLVDMYRAFVACANRERNVLEMEVQTAQPLGPDELDAVVQSVGKAVGMAVRPRVTTDAGLIGGLVVRVGDVVLDGSVATRLRRLQHALQTTRIQNAG